MIGRIAMAALVAGGALLARDASALPRAADLRAAAESLGSVETVQEPRRPRRVWRLGKRRTPVPGSGAWFRPVPDVAPLSDRRVPYSERRGSLSNRGITAGPESGGPLRYSPGLHGNQ